MKGLRSILVANRGEIALRVMRTAQSLGYRTIAVYSEADANAPHVTAADDAVLLGPAPAAESYLDPERILQAASVASADAIHPGYGFLSENAAFARAVEQAGLVFIGPTADAIELMGNKAAAKRRMLEAGIPCVPGYEGADQSDAAMLAAAERIGFPVMVKAAAGGGGRGMRLVADAAVLPNALRSARSEAVNAFGSDELILEKAILRPRHVEFQVFADSRGNTIHLGERDCSVQRRHQKVVEEAPCPVMTDELRARMGAAAVEAAHSIGYRGAGTVEFLLDQEGDFYFLEMNTRLQVEHPVTEMITGLDLVAMQIRVAEGGALPLKQDEVRLTGHAIEVRLYAEDPEQDFLPVSGRIAEWTPACGDGIRVDAGITSGQEISPFYDPMIAKVIAWGADRAAATSRLIQALMQTRLFGLKTNKAFLVEILQNENFRRGQATTAFIAEEFAGPIGGDVAIDAADTAAATVLAHLAERDRARARSLGCSEELLDWSTRGESRTHFRFSDGKFLVDAVLSAQSADHYCVLLGNERVECVVHSRDTRTATISLDARRETIPYLVEWPGLIHLARHHRTIALRNELAYAGHMDDKAGGGRITAPMHGVLIEIFVRPGDKVTKGTRLAILEAMKMQHELLSDVAGEVKAVSLAAGAQVAADDLLIEISVDENP